MQGGLEAGARVTLSVPMIGPIRGLWEAEHIECVPGRMFRDVQKSGPFASWDHTHRFEPVGPNECELIDEIHYTLPLGALGRALGGAMVRRKLESMFAWRHAVTRSDLLAHRGVSPMRMAITGASGLIGRPLLSMLLGGGHAVEPMNRKGARPSFVNAIGDVEGFWYWNPQSAEIHPSVSGLDGVVHLAGETIVGRWNPRKKQRIRDSRVTATHFLCQSLARLPKPPRVLIVASAVGYYGNRGDEMLTEQSSAGSGFLAEVGQAWEAATEPAKQAGIRVVHLRLGVVLTPRGGALAKMLPAFRAGAGGILGSGQQYWPWISIEDVIGSIYHAIRHESVAGPVNLVAPQQVTNQQFTRTLGQVLHRPTIFPVPAFAARLAFGEMADEALLASQRVVPEVLLNTGYRFRHGDLRTALSELLGR